MVLRRVTQIIAITVIIMIIIIVATVMEVKVVTIVRRVVLGSKLLVTLGSCAEFGVSVALHN